MENMTAVEWLEKQLLKQKQILKDHFEKSKWNDDRCSEIDNCLSFIEQAKQMELEWQEYFFNCGRQYQLTGECTFNQVLAETFKK